MKDFFKRNWDIMLCIVLVLVVRSTKVIAINVVDGHSMDSTLTNGQLTLGSSLANYQRGDIVIIKKDNGELLIKRIIGLPGETVKSKEGKIYINDVLLEEDYIDDENNIESSKNDWVVKLEDDEYFVMGDNRDHSGDSRYYGPFKKERIIEKVYLY